MASKVASPPKVGILSIGDMGMGIAKLLIAKGFPVVTNCQGRSEETVERARDANVEVVTSDLDLATRCSVILSVVPPRDAEATAQRIIDALSGGSSRDEPLYFVDLNAVSPATIKGISSAIDKARVPVKLIDGCILGAPPRPSSGEDAKTNVAKADDSEAGWVRPRIPVSGPHTLSPLPDGDRLAETLNFSTVSQEIGAASGLKMCFAAMSKGFTAIATQSMATARRLGVYDELVSQMGDMLPSHLELVERSVPTMPPKAYRWVREMEEISATMSEEGGWQPEMFMGAAGIYQAVADDEVLGKEKTGKRKRGKTVKDVAEAMAEGLERKKKKND